MLKIKDLYDPVNLILFTSKMGINLGIVDFPAIDFKKYYLSNNTGLGLYEFSWKKSKCCSEDIEIRLGFDRMETTVLFTKQKIVYET